MKKQKIIIFHRHFTLLELPSVEKGRRMTEARIIESWKNLPSAFYAFGTFRNVPFLIARHNS
jgi:hypothetical protein